MTHLINPEIAFKKAIKTFLLSSNPDKPNYAGNYMYMCNDVKNDKSVMLFKHIDTREYLFVPYLNN